MSMQEELHQRTPFRKTPESQSENS